MKKSPAEIEDYAFLSDTQSGALISRDGSVDWLCFRALIPARVLRRCSETRIMGIEVFGRALEPGTFAAAIFQRR